MRHDADAAMTGDRQAVGGALVRRPRWGRRAAPQDWSGPGLRGKFFETIKAYLRLVDENSDGTISQAEIKVVVVVCFGRIL